VINMCGMRYAASRVEARITYYLNGANMLTEMSDTRRQLANLFHAVRYASTR
jgi:hypothetical protein